MVRVLMQQSAEIHDPILRPPAIFASIGRGEKTDVSAGTRGEHDDVGIAFDRFVWEGVEGDERIILRLDDERWTTYARKMIFGARHRIVLGGAAIASVRGRVTFIEIAYRTDLAQRAKIIKLRVQTVLKAHATTQAVQEAPLIESVRTAFDRVSARAQIERRRDGDDAEKLGKLRRSVIRH